MKKVEIDPEKGEEQLKEQLEKVPLEKGDLLAMIMAGLLVLLPVLLLIGGLVLFSLWFVVGRG